MYKKSFCVPLIAPVWFCEDKENINFIKTKKNNLLHIYLNLGTDVQVLTTNCKWLFKHI